jgi:hypothetical protein
MRPSSRLFGIWVLLCGLFASALPDTAPGQDAVPSRDRIAIKVVLEKFRSALQASDGEAAYKLLDTATHKWYEDALKDALTVKKPELAMRDYLGKLTILRLRHDFTRPQLEKKTGKEVIVDGVKKGWIGGSFTDMIVIQYVGKDQAGMVFATLRQAPKTPAFYFASEENQWKLALSYTFSLANKGFEQLQTKSGLTGEDFMCKMLEDATRKKVDRAIFDGPRAGDAKSEEKK